MEPIEFLGKPVEYWCAVDATIKERKLEEVFDRVATLEAQRDELIVIVAKYCNHEQYCWADLDFWDSSCNCGLHELLTSLPPDIQNAIDDAIKEDING